MTTISKASKNLPDVFSPLFSRLLELKLYVEPEQQILQDYSALAPAVDVQRVLDVIDTSFVYKKETSRLSYFHWDFYLFLNYFGGEPLWSTLSSFKAKVETSSGDTFFITGGVNISEESCFIWNNGQFGDNTYISLAIPISEIGGFVPSTKNYDLFYIYPQTIPFNDGSGEFYPAQYVSAPVDTPYENLGGYVVDDLVWNPTAD
jgi:hypothetical protein